MGKILRYSCIPQWVRKLELLVSIVDIYLQIFLDLVIGKASGSDRVIFSGRNLLQLCDDLGLPKFFTCIRRECFFSLNIIFFKYLSEQLDHHFFFTISSPFMLLKKVTAK